MMLFIEFTITIVIQNTTDIKSLLMFNANKNDRKLEVRHDV